MLFLYCKEMKLYMSYNICPIDIYLYLTYNCEKIKTKITVLMSLFLLFSSRVRTCVLFRKFHYILILLVYIIYYIK